MQTSFPSVVTSTSTSIHTSNTNIKVLNRVNPIKFQNGSHNANEEYNENADDKEEDEDEYSEDSDKFEFFDDIFDISMEDDSSDESEGECDDSVMLNRGIIST